MPGRRRLRIRLSYVVLGIIIFVIVFSAASLWLNWTILQSMYSSKAGLDWFSINFYGGWTFIVAALLALLFVNPAPRRSDLFEAFNSMMGLQYRANPYTSRYGGDGIPTRRIRPVYIRTSVNLWLFWQVVKWVVLFVIFASNNGFPLFSNLTIVVDLALKGFGSWALVPRIAALPLLPASGQELIVLIPTMEIQYQILVYFLTVFLIVVALRFFLKFIRDAIIRAGDKWIRNIFVSLSAIMLTVLLSVPYWAMDIRIPYEFGAVLTVFISFAFLAAYFHFKVTRDTVPLAQRRRLGIVAATVILVGLLAFNLAAVIYYTANLNNNWIAYEWQPLTQKQVTVSRWTAGIQNINYTTISNLPSGNASKTLSLIRQWSSNASYTQSKNEIGVNYYRLVNSPEIVYEYGQEYWVTPTTFNYPDPTDWVAVHLQYTHTSKIIVMNSHTGDFVNVTQAYRLKSQPLIYYGEDLPGQAGFSNDVYVHVKGAPAEIENVSYSGQPDYTLCGAQRGLWFLEQGQFGFSLSPPQNCIQMLHARNVFDRVQNILISGLLEDNSTYLVTDSAAGGNNLYYTIQVYIDYPLETSFSAIPLGPNQGPLDYLRFFGVVLVNVADGSMQGYTVAQPDGFLASFYKEYYPTWGPPPAWLKAQLRYPEQLLGTENTIGQLDADFVLHVSDPSTFKQQSSFFVRPPSTEVLYIPFVIQNNVSFTAVQLVEFYQSQGVNLAGLYVVYGGNQLGQMWLYATNATGTNPTPLLGPSAALTAFDNDPATTTEVTLTHATPGNILLYPVNGHLYYFIPAYIYQNGGSGVIARNPFIDVIDAQNSSAPVRLFNSTNPASLNYGFNTVIPATNESQRASYMERLFTSAGIALDNATVNFTNAVTNVGTTSYNVDSENASATAFVNNFINSYVKNPVYTNGTLKWTPQGTVFYWIPANDPNALDFAFVVAANGFTQMYVITVVVGT
jgi:hypothetical protein